MIWGNSGQAPHSTPAAAPEPQSKAYVDFAKDCFRPQAEIQSNPEQRRRPICSRLPRKYGTDGVRGNRLFDSPGRLSVPFAEMKGTPNCTIQYGNVHFSMQRGSVSRWLPQSPSVTVPSRRELMFTPMRLVGTACGGLLPSSAKADATSLREEGSVHADAAMQNQVF